ncbi:MAG: MarR family winged helix-turn-helix transcriptional regulator, partial [candidate division NC10 bacterium]
MTESSLASTNALEPVDCVSYRLRRAARITAKSYDNALRPIGLRNTQFTLLASLNRLGETSIGDLSEALAVDGTTLTRNLEVLVRRGLVENIAADDARVRNVRLTDLGKETFEEAAAGFGDFFARIEGHATRHPYPIAVAMEGYNGHVR